MIFKNPHDIDEADPKGKLPLHHATEARPITESSPRYQDNFVIQRSMDLCPPAANVQDREGKLPLTLAFEVALWRKCAGHFWVPCGPMKLMRAYMCWLLWLW